MELFKHTLFINLASRTDRLQHVQQELKKMNIDFYIDKIDVINKPNSKDNIN